MTRMRQEAYENLRLDTSFFEHMLRGDAGDNAQDEDRQDFDIYLMEKSVMPVVLQGLDALARHIDKMSSGDGANTKEPGRVPFNPLTWLAQFLLRNHPRHVKDHRTPMYEKFSELASIERGRRCLLRKRPDLEKVWSELSLEGDALGGENCSLTFAQLPLFVNRCDEAWRLDGAFSGSMPSDFEGLIQLPEGGSEAVQFFDFWEWFEAHVQRSDVLRAEAFVEAERRVANQEEQERREQEEEIEKEFAAQEAFNKRANLEESFEAISADMYINEEIRRIMNKGAVITGVEEKEEGPPLQGEHIALILALLRLWNCPIAPGLPEDEWNEGALVAFRKWLAEREIGDISAPRMDSIALRALMDRDAFLAFVKTAYPMNEALFASEDKPTVEIQSLVDSGTDVFVEAIDESTGEVLQFLLPDELVEKVKARLAHGEGAGPLVAAVDQSGCVCGLLPAH